jgi:hypothetical protein
MDPQPATGGGWDNLGDEDFPADLLDDERWKDLKCKGQNLVTAMPNSTSQSAQLQRAHGMTRVSTCLNVESNKAEMQQVLSPLGTGALTQTPMTFMRTSLTMK